MNMQQLMVQAQKAQREMNKALEELHQKEFSVTKAGLVKICVMGDKSISEITIEPDAFEKDNKEMIEEMIIMGINELQEQISKEEEKINDLVSSKYGGLGF